MSHYAAEKQIPGIDDTRLAYEITGEKSTLRYLMAAYFSSVMVCQDGTTEYKSPVIASMPRDCDGLALDVVLAIRANPEAAGQLPHKAHGPCVFHMHKEGHACPYSTLRSD